MAGALNRTKDLDFLTQNRLIFLVQKNIIQQANGAAYEGWFQFAEKSRNTNNEAEDFEEVGGDEVFEEMMRRLDRGELTEEDEE